MLWRLLTAEEISKEFPRQVTPIVAVVGETDSDGELWCDTCFVLYNDGIVQTPHAEVPVDQLRGILSMLESAITTRFETASAP